MCSIWTTINITHRYLADHRRRKGWGYGASAPPDFKSTPKDFYFLPLKYFLLCQLAPPNLTTFLHLCSRYRPMQYILVKGDAIEVNPYAIQLFHRVKGIRLKSQIQAMVFIQGKHLWPYLNCILRLLSEGGYYKDHIDSTVHYGSYIL